MKSNTILKSLLMMIGLTIATISIGCGTVDPQEDTTAPATISDLVVDSTIAGVVYLSWTAPGDDGSEGTASDYELKYYSSAITSGNWASATEDTSVTNPNAFGTSEHFAVEGLNINTVYYFAIKAKDEIPNESGISNVVDNAPSGSLTNLTRTDCDSFGIPLEVDNFDNIAGVELHIDYNADSVSFESIESSYLTGALVNASGGTIHVVWADIDNLISIPNGAELLRFNFSGLSGQTALAFDSECEIVNHDGAEIDIEFTAGTLICND